MPHNTSRVFLIVNAQDVSISTQRANRAFVDRHSAQPIVLAQCGSVGVHMAGAARFVVRAARGEQ